MEAILSTEGIDRTWIRPADLANSLGLDLTTDSGRQETRGRHHAGAGGLPQDRSRGSPGRSR